jgi:hypothetical protein
VSLPLLQGGIFAIYFFIAVRHRDPFLAITSPQLLLRNESVHIVAGRGLQGSLRKGVNILPRKPQPVKCQCPAIESAIRDPQPATLDNVNGLSNGGEGDGNCGRGSQQSRVEGKQWRRFCILYIWPTYRERKRRASFEKGKIPPKKENKGSEGTKPNAAGTRSNASEDAGVCPGIIAYKIISALIPQQGIECRILSNIN